MRAEWPKVPPAIHVSVKARPIPTIIGKMAAPRNEFLGGSSRIQIGYVKLIEGWWPPRNREQLYWQKYNLKGSHYTRIAFHGMLIWGFEIETSWEYEWSWRCLLKSERMVGNNSLEFVWKACENLPLVPKWELVWQGTSRLKWGDGELVTEVSLDRELCLEEGTIKGR